MHNRINLTMKLLPLPHSVADAQEGFLGLG
jgi:hypothetical protein